MQGQDVNLLWLCYRGKVMNETTIQRRFNDALSLILSRGGINAL